MVWRLRVERHGPRARSRACLAAEGCLLLLCAKGFERAFDEGFACGAHCVGEGCELV